MRLRLPALCALTATTLFMAACDDGDDDGGTFSSGVEPSKTVSSLSDDEAQQFCDATERSFGNLVSARKACELASVFFTEDAESCRAFTNQCVQAPPEPEPEGEPEPQDCAIADAANRMGCEETIETLEGCIGSVRSLSVSALNSITCSDAGNAEGLETKFADLPMGLDQVPGCETIAANCPALFPEDEDVSMSMSSFPDAE